MDTLRMLHEIEKKKCIYNIHYCKAGVGFCFYEGPFPAYDVEDWKKYLSTYRYYPTFEEAVKGEWGRMKEKS